MKKPKLPRFNMKRLLRGEAEAKRGEGKTLDEVERELLRGHCREGGEVRHDALDRVIDLVRRERAAQEDKWGEQNHAPAVYLAILVEEVGEAAKEVNEIRFGSGDAAKLTQELVQVAAVAVAMVEALIRAKAVR